MATLSRLSKKALKLSPSLSLPFNHHFSTAAAAAIETPLPLIRQILESPNRVKWDYRGQRRIIPLGQWNPNNAVDSYVAPNVVLAGQVTVWDVASVWNGAVLRGDLNKISVGFCSNV